MISRSQVIAEAREWIGTPFHHQARIKGVGVDCVGLVLGVAWELGIAPRTLDEKGYPRVPDGVSLMRTMRGHAAEIDRADMQPGDVIVLSFDRDPQHLGILGDYRHGGLSIIHAAGNTGRVIETRLMFSPAMKFVAAFALPGVN
jgi:cell wall-associated NlpC family hydrolase